jgi:hypothetical protein
MHLLHFLGGHGIFPQAATSWEATATFRKQ